MHFAGVGVATVAQAGAGCRRKGCLGALALMPIAVMVGSILGAVRSFGNCFCRVKYEEAKFCCGGSLNSSFG